MNKKDESVVQAGDGRDVAKPIISSDNISRSSGLKLFTDFYKKQTPLFVGLVIVVLVILGLILWRIDASQNKVTSADEPKIQNLLNSFDCSQPAMNSVASYKPSSQAIETSIRLLNYRSSCDVKNNQYVKAIADYKEEQSYCKLADDTTCVNDLQTFIDNLSSSIKSNSEDSK